MLIHQISVFVENRPGRLGEIMGVMQQADIDIRALSLADTSDFGILRMIVNNPEKAVAVFQEHGIMASITDVIAAELADKPGALQHVLTVLSEKGISVEYIYAFITRKDQDACVILRIEDNQAALKILSNAGVDLLRAEDVYGI